MKNQNSQTKLLYVNGKHELSSDPLHSQPLLVSTQGSPHGVILLGVSGFLLQADRLPLLPFLCSLSSFSTSACSFFCSRDSMDPMGNSEVPFLMPPPILVPSEEAEPASLLPHKGPPRSTLCRHTLQVGLHESTQSMCTWGRTVINEE